MHLGFLGFRPVLPPTHHHPPPNEQGGKMGNDVSTNKRDLLQTTSREKEVTNTEYYATTLNIDVAFPSVFSRSRFASFSKEEEGRSSIN